MFFQQVYDKSLAQASYVIGCQAKGVAMVIDAQRDIDVYLQIAKENKLQITHIAETHIHADFLCGSRELSAATGGELYLSAEGGPDWIYEFPHHGLKDRDSIQVGNLKVEVIHTPGHTPESISFLLTDTPASDQPVMLFTGDFIFVGDIGRPDLLEKAAGIKGTQEKGAQQMYLSIKEIDSIPDFVQIWPGHGAGSACGKALGAVPSSTVGYEKIRNWAFQYKNDESGFVNYLLEGQPEPPRYFATMKHLNKVQRPLLVQVPQHVMLSKEDFLAAYNNGITVIDTRHKSEFAQGHLPGSINIEGNNGFSTWMGWIIDYQEQFILLADADKREDLTRKLMRIGMDNIYGFFSDINSLGIALEKTNIADIQEVKAKLNQNDPQIVDVRGAAEYEKGHIPGVKHLFLGTLANNLDQLDPEKETIVHCQSGVRASIAYSIMRKNGFKNIKSFDGSMNQWKKEGNEVAM